MTRLALIVALAGVGAGPLARPARALPTMIRLGYVNCVACHIQPQGGSLLNEYGRGIDEAQSRRAGEYVRSGNRLAKALSWGGRITQDVRFAGQETVNTPGGGPVTDSFRGRFMYRNNTELGMGFRVHAVVVGETLAAARPNLPYSPAATPTQVYVPTALLAYRAAKGVEISVGRDQLPNGLNLPDLGLYVKARDQYGFYDAPTQAKVYWWTDRFTVAPYVFGPSGNERAGFHESGGGMLAEMDVLGNHRTVVGVNGLRGTSHNVDRTAIGPYARLGFGRWGVFAEHDFTGRQLKNAAGTAHFRQEASYGQVFFAVREWLVPSVGIERLIVHSPFKETLVAPRLELSARLTPNFTLGFVSRIQQNAITGKTAPMIAVQLAMKTVY
jgi:hypothetical protein